MIEAILMLIGGITTYLFIGFLLMVYCDLVTNTSTNWDTEWVVMIVAPIILVMAIILTLNAISKKIKSFLDMPKKIDKIEKQIKKLSHSRTYKKNKSREVK